MIISHRHRFIFLKTKKTGGTSVELALSRICGPDDVITRVSAEDEVERIGPGPQNLEIPERFRPAGWRLRRFLGVRASKAGTEYYNHMPASEVRNAMDASLFDTYRKLTIVRNPWDREVSLYYWTYRDRQDRPSFDSFVRKPRYRPDRKNFEVYSIGGRIVADVVLRYERLQEDFTAFVESLGVSPAPTLPRAKGGHRAQGTRDYRKMYTPETRRIVERRFRREIGAFGYEF
jgi:hypothetical protein